MKKLIAFCLVSICGVMPALYMSSFESVPPGNWAKVESLSQGEEISLKMLFGDKMEGKYVEIKDTIRGFKELADGKYDHLPEQAFYMCGGIEDAIENAKKMEQ